MGLFGVFSKLSGADKKTIISVQQLDFIISTVRNNNFTTQSFADVMSDFGIALQKPPSGYPEATLLFAEVHSAHIMLNPSEKTLKVGFSSRLTASGSFNRIELFASSDEKLMIAGEDNYYVKLMAEELEKSGYQLMVDSSFFQNRM